MKGEIMKKQTLAAAAALSLLFAASQAEALYIADTYWGAGEAGTPNDGKETTAGRSGDVYDLNNEGYNISGMDVTISSSGLLTVKIYSISDNYFRKWMDDTDNFMAAPGSLFLSTSGWTPLPSDTDPDPDENGEQNYNSDGIGVGTNWDFAVVLNNLYDYNQTEDTYTPNYSGTTALYSMTQANGEIKYGTEREAQEAWFNPTGTVSPSGSWAINPPTGTSLNSYLTITTDLSGIDGWASVREWGLHWTMACANDVIEGSFSPVPEPATALLFGAGLAGLTAFGRRRGRD